MQDSALSKGETGKTSSEERLKQENTSKIWKFTRPEPTTCWLSNNDEVKPDKNKDHEWAEITNGILESFKRRRSRRKKPRRRLLEFSIGLGVIIAIIVAIMVIMTLQKGDDTEAVESLFKVNIEVTILNMQYTDVLADKGSQEFISFQEDFCSEIEKQYNSGGFSNSYDGCVLTDVRNGSLRIRFTVVFLSQIPPLQSIVKSVLTRNSVTLENGQVQIIIGVYVLEEETIVVGQVTALQTDENLIPTVPPSIMTTSTKTSTHTTTRKTTDSSGTISTEKATLPNTTIKTTAPSQTITSSPETIPMSLKTTKDSATPTVFQTTSSETAISSTSTSFPKASKSHSTVKGSTVTSATSNLPTFSTTMLSKQSDKKTASSTLTTNPPTTTKAVIATTNTQSQTGSKATKTTAIPLSRETDMSDSTKTIFTTVSSLIPRTSITTTSPTPTRKDIPTNFTQITTSSKRTTTSSPKLTYSTILTSDTLRSTGATLPKTASDVSTRTTETVTPETSSAVSTRTFQLTSAARLSSSSATRISTSSAKTASSINSTKSTDTTTPMPTTSGKTKNPVTTRKNNATTNLLTTKAKTELPTSASPFTSSPISVSAKSTSSAPSATPSSYSGSNTIQSSTSVPNNSTLKVVISYLPPLSQLEISEVEMIIFEVVDARNAAVITLEQTTNSVQLIINITFSDDTMKKTYGPGRRSHVDVSVDRSEDQAVVNATLKFSPVQCNDAATYKCKVTPKDVSSETAETSVDIGVYRRPEKPHLTLSYDIVAEQEPWSDRTSKCEGEVGYPAGYFVVEVLMSGSFVDYTDWWPFDAQEKETDCGTYKTQQFVFYPNQTDYLNNKQLRCAVRNDNPISDEQLPVSDAKTIHVVQSDYCEGISSIFYEHPYECHAFVDCSTASPGNMHFQLCGAQTCPNRETGCDVASCTTLCNREITKTTGKITTTTTNDFPSKITSSAAFGRSLNIVTRNNFSAQFRKSYSSIQQDCVQHKYMRCNHTVEGNIDSTLIINCVLGNTDEPFVGNITVYKEQDIFINGSGNEGTITDDEQSATLTYSASAIKLEIEGLACHQAGTYTFVVNELLERSVMVVAKRRPEKPHLTLSYDIVDGQEPWGDRASKCEGEVGNPAGYFVVEVLMSGSFVNYTDWWPLNAQETETDCGTYKTQQFVFYSHTLDSLNGKKIRCAVRNDNPIPEENLPVSDAKTIHVVQSDYCEGIDWQVYEHPYECHAFVDCLTASPGNMHFKLCGSPNTCPNRETGCDVASSTTLCSREFTTATTTQLPLKDPSRDRIKGDNCVREKSKSKSPSGLISTSSPSVVEYLRCNYTVEGNIDSTLIINCVLGNTDNSFVENITVFKDQDIFLSGNGNEGTITVDEQSATLTYTASAIKLEIASLACKQAGTYTFVVNELLERSVVVVATAYPEEPILTVGEFITNHQASIRCEGNLGYPKGTTDMQLQRKFAGDTKFMVMTEGVSEFEDSDVLNCTTVKALETKIIVTSDWNSAQLQCVTNTNNAIFESAITTIDLEQQSVYISPENPSAEIGKPFNVTCEIVDVSELTLIRFFRNDQLICRSVINVVTSSEEGIVCTSKFDSSGGTLDISFLSIQCRDEGEYRCVPNSEASTAATVYLQVTREQHNNPSMISIPKTLIANTQMLYFDSFTCQGEVDYPSGRRSVVLQTNKNGQFESYFNGERSTQISRDECRVNDTMLVKWQTFGTSWNNTQLRCAIEDNGEATNFVSEEYTLQLLPDNYCEENPERSPHPFECHYHIWCTVVGLYVYDCNSKCPVVTNGNSTVCQPCSVPCH